MNDELIRDKIKETLARHPLVDSSDINVFVYKGDVTLIGSVQTKKQKNLVEQLVKQSAEVGQVIVRLEVKSEAVTLRLPSLESIFQNPSRI